MKNILTLVAVSLFTISAANAQEKPMQEKLAMEKSCKKSCDKKDKEYSSSKESKKACCKKDKKSCDKKQEQKPMNTSDNKM